MMRAKRLYRAVAVYLVRVGPGGEIGEVEVRRHFQTKKARDVWAKHRREGYPEREGIGWEDEGMGAIEPALRVETSRSKPIEWEDER